MSAEATVRSSVSEDALLELLTGAGLDEAQAIALLGEQVAAAPRQQPDEDHRSFTSADHSGQRPSESESERVMDQSVRERSAFERSVLASLENMGRRLDYLTSRVDGPDTDATPRNSSRLDESTGTAANGPWADIPMDEVPDYAAPLAWDDGAEAEPSRLLDVSESTKKAVTQVFAKPLGNQSRLQVRKPYAFPNLAETKLDLVAKQLLSKDAKDADTTMAHLQTMML